MIAFFLPLLAILPIEEVRTIEAHLLIQNEKAALNLAKKCYAKHPDEPLAFELLIKSLAKVGRDSEMMKLWCRFNDQFPKESEDQEILESMCWGILKKGRESSQSTTKLLALIGAALTQDMYAVDFLFQGMRSSNVQQRTVAVQLASLFKDHQLKEEIERLLDRERNARVRIEAIRACGELKADYLLPRLMGIIASNKSLATEKKEAIRAVLRIRDSIDIADLQGLCESKRSGLRLLACECIAKFHMPEQADRLSILMYDSNPDVAAAAIHAIGLLKIQHLRGKPAAFYLGRLAYAKEPKIGIAAAWALLLQRATIGSEALTYWLRDERPHVAALAAAAIAKSGPYGVETAWQMLDEVKGPFVVANLALSLIGQREHVEEACGKLASALTEQKERWMIGEELFSPLQANRLTHRAEIPNYPEVVNQTTRLELLNLLAILDYPGAQEAIKHFLKERRWGITGLAAEKLLGEGDESALQLVRELLDDADQNVRLEAALALAIWGRDPSALPTLMEEYPRCDRMTQIKILESLGRVGKRDLIPFLIERLKESSLNMRVIAASILLQILKN